MASSSSGNRLAKTLPEGYLYPEGKKLAVKVHMPMQPFGHPAYSSPFDVDAYCMESKDISSMSREDLVFAKPSRTRAANEAMPDDANLYLRESRDDTAALRITENLSHSTNGGPQVVLCIVERPLNKLWEKMGWKKHNHPTRVVAKIFDPLYYPDVHPLLAALDESPPHLDPVSLADQGYAHEAAAYMELHEKEAKRRNEILRDTIAKFYGTVSLQLTRDVGDERQSRNVRIILMEYIAGKPLSSISECSWEDHLLIRTPPKTISEEDAKIAFAQILHTATAMEHTGVFHDGLNASNVLVVLGNPKAEPKIKRVVLIGFHQAEVMRYTKEGKHFAQSLPRPLHPVSRYGLNGFQSFVGWFPVTWLKESIEKPFRPRQEDEEMIDLQMEEEDDQLRRDFLKENDFHDSDFDEIDTDDVCLEPTYDDEAWLMWQEWAYKVLCDNDFTRGREAEDIVHKRDQIRQEEAMDRIQLRAEERRKARQEAREAAAAAAIQSQRSLDDEAASS